MRAVIIAMALARSQASRAESKSRPKTPKNRIRAVSGYCRYARRRRAPPRPQDARAEPLLTQTNDETATPPKKKQTRPAGRDASES